MTLPHVGGRRRVARIGADHERLLLPHAVGDEAYGVRSRNRFGVFLGSAVLLEGAEGFTEAALRENAASAREGPR